MQLAEQRKYSDPQARISLRDVLSRQLTAISKATEQAYVHLVDVLNDAHEQEFLINPRVVAHYAGCEGATECSSLFPQRSVLRDGHGPGEQFVAAVIIHGFAEELRHRQFGRIGGGHKGLRGVLSSPVAHSPQRVQDNGRQRADHRSQRAGNCPVDGGYTYAERDNELDGEILVRLTLLLGGLELVRRGDLAVACFGEVAVVRLGRLVLAMGSGIHGTTLQAGQQDVRAAQVTRLAPAHEVTPGEFGTRRGEQLGVGVQVLPVELRLASGQPR